MSRMFSHPRPHILPQQSFVASAMAKGTFSLASVCARKVLPQPVGPSIRILLFCISTSGSTPILILLVLIIYRYRQYFLASSWPITYSSRNFLISFSPKQVNAFRLFPSRFGQELHHSHQGILRPRSVFSPDPGSFRRTTPVLIVKSIRHWCFLLPAYNHFIDQAISFGFFRAHVIIPLGYPSLTNGVLFCSVGEDLV